MSNYLVIFLCCYWGFGINCFYLECAYWSFLLQSRCQLCSAWCLASPSMGCLMLFLRCRDYPPLTSWGSEPCFCCSFLAFSSLCSASHQLHNTDSFLISLQTTFVYIDSFKGFRWQSGFNCITENWILNILFLHISLATIPPHKWNFSLITSSTGFILLKQCSLLGSPQCQNSCYLLMQRPPGLS